MDDNLDSRLTMLLSSSDKTAILQGLVPICGRSERLFGADAQFEGQILPFCLGYISQIPNLTTEIAATAKSLNLAPLLEAHISLSNRYLASACDEIEQSTKSVGLEQFLILLQGAYIFSRMLEELDDKVELFVGAPLTHLNLMDANLIVHGIIGDSFANRLDKIVTSLVKQSQVTKIVIEAGLNKERIEEAVKSHRSLTGKAIENFAANYKLDMASRIP